MICVCARPGQARNTIMITIDALKDANGKATSVNSIQLLSCVCWSRTVAICVNLLECLSGGTPSPAKWLAKQLGSHLGMGSCAA